MAAEVGTAQLIQMDGFWFPEYDAGYPQLPHALIRNAKDIAVSAALCNRRRVCVQAGGHVGIWPIALSFMFDKVLTFEPQPLAFEALLHNAAREIKARRIQPERAALGALPKPMRIQAGQNSATWRKVEESAPLFPQIDVPCVTIDDRLLGYACDAIYLDVEGGELAALKGAEKTIRHCKPVLHLEVFDQNRADLERFVFGLGYKFVRSVHKDSVYVPN